MRAIEFGDMDELRGLMHNSKQILLDMERREKEKTGF